MLKKGNIFPIARLVYITYIGPIKSGYEIDHIDNNPDNDHFSNLQQLSKSANVRKIYSDNANYYRELEIIKSQEKLKRLEKRIIVCDELQKEWKNMVECGHFFGVTKQAIYKSIKTNSKLKKIYTLRKKS